MTAIRRKITSETTPATSMTDAEAMLSRYAILLAEKERIAAEADCQLEHIMNIRDETLAPVENEMAALFDMLHRWWASSRHIATKGTRKSVLLGGCHIGERTTTPALALPEGKDEEEVIAAILTLPGGGRDWLVTRHALARPALIRALRGGKDSRDHLILAHGLGLSASQREEFFIDTPPMCAVAAEETA